MAAIRVCHHILLGSRVQGRRRTSGGGGAGAQRRCNKPCRRAQHACGASGCATRWQNRPGRHALGPESERVWGSAESPSSAGAAPLRNALAIWGRGGALGAGCKALQGGWRGGPLPPDTVPLSGGIGPSTSQLCCGGCNNKQTLCFKRTLCLVITRVSFFTPLAAGAALCSLGRSATAPCAQPPLHLGNPSTRQQAYRCVAAAAVSITAHTPPGAAPQAWPNAARRRHSRVRACSGFSCS